MSEATDAATAFAATVSSRVNDEQRLTAVDQTGLLDTPAESGFDRIASIAARMLDTPFGFVTVVDETRSFWKACFGVDATDPAQRQNPVEESFCQYVIGVDDAFLINDTRADPRTMNNPSIDSMGVLAWAGVPLRAPGGEVLGTVCVVDTRVRSWTADDAALLFELSEIAADAIASVQGARAASRSQELLAAVLANAPIGFALVDDELRYEIVNETLAAINGLSVDEHLGRPIGELLPDVAGSVEPMLRGVLATGEPVTGIEVIGSTPAEPGVERVWSASFYRLEVGSDIRAGLFVEEITEQMRARRRADRLASISTALARSTTMDDIEKVVVDEIGNYFEAATALVGHWDPDTQTTTILATPAAGDVVRATPLTIDDDAPYAEAARTGLIVTVGDPDDRRERYTSSVGSELVAEAAVPCTTGDGTFTGILSIGWNRRIRPGDFPISQLQTIAGLLAGVFERNRITRQRRELIDNLQQALLIPPPPRPGLDVVVRYRPAGDAFGFGGDWYDVVGLDDARTALVVGDVVGHDPSAAARMSQIASIIGQLLLSDVDMSDVFSEVERVMAARRVDTMATVGVVVVDTVERTLTAISAGHLPGALVHPDGTVELLEPALRPPLCAGDVSIRPDRTGFLPGTKLVLFTDGLVETRTGDIDADLTRLTGHLATLGDATIDDIADRLLDEFAADRDYDDDIALIVAQLH